MSNHIDDILNSVNHEDKKEIEQLLKDREVNQDIDNKQSIIDTYNQFSSPKENSVFIQKLQQMQNRIEKVKDTGVRNRAITDFNEKDIKSHNKFPGEDHPIFEHFFQLANKYPNRDFLISSIMNKIKEKQNKIDIKIKYSLEDIETLKDIELYKITNPKHWQDDLSDEVINLYNHTNIDTINLQIQQLNEKKENIDDWKRIKNGIRISDISTTKKIKDNLYYNIMGEFDKLFEFCTNVGGIMEYRAKIPVKTFTPIDVHSALASELEKQIGLCEEPCTHNFFYSDGEGRLIPFEINRDILYYIHENTTFIKFNKKNPEYRDGRIINSDALFKNVPKFVNKVQYKNLNLVGFNNKFYNVKSGKLQPLNAYAPILPLKNCNTELYLHRNIDDDIITQNDNERIINVDNIIPIEYNPMEHIFNECFSEEDRKSLLAYIGCCLYDKGYTQRQESIFLMSKGGTGKGLDINEWLPTPNGWVQMKDLQVGDLLFDEKGNVCSVVHKSPIHNIDCYKIVFENGFEMIVDKDHKWLSKTEGEKKHKVRATQEMYEYMQKSNRKRDSFYYAIDTNKPLQLKEQDLIIPPYVLGAWLGDGNSNDGRITNDINDNQIIDEIEKDGFVTKRHSHNNDNTRVQIYDLKQKLRQLNVLGNKKIPLQYLRSSYSQRLSLLQGIMDTDGHIDKRGSCEVTWKSKKMINQLRELLFSLGIKSNISEKLVQLKDWDEPRMYYRLFFKTNLPVFRLQRKLDKIPNYELRKTQYTRYIKKIIPVSSIPTQCIQVDSPSKLFLATKEFIPTHNSTFIKAICQIFYKSDSQLVNQLGERFGFSIFADNDCVIIDEIQQAKKEFANILKDISTGSNMPIEKKYVDGFSLPAENIPRVWFIGNQFPTVLYYLSNSPGVSRRILCIVPIKPIQDLGYTYDQITTDSCKQWLVQQATLEYMRQGLHLDDKSPIQVDNTIKEQRIEMCTFPEKYFIEKHFELVYNDDNVLDMDEFVYYDEMHDFIYECIIDNMLEPTVKKGVSQTFINNFKEAFGLTNANYHTSKYRNRIKMKGVKPKTNKAIDFFNKCNIDE